MTKNPFYNALAALGYIILIVFGINYIFNLQTFVNQFMATFIPIILLSLLTLSVAVMAYVFGYQPLILLLDNKRKEAISLFLKTVAIFGVITFILILIYFILL